MPSIALVTYTQEPDLTADDRLLAQALVDLGLTAEATVWDDPGVAWADFDLVLLRSMWDYFLHFVPGPAGPSGRTGPTPARSRPSRFSAWLDELERLGVHLVNSAQVVRWNGDKRYLLHLAQAGIATIPTEVVSAAEPHTSLAERLRDRGWDAAVVKPAVSGDAHDTWRTSRETADADQGEFDAARARAPGGVLIQPFVHEVIRDGEWSLVFLDGEYSHAAIKRPRDGDFRVQKSHGGRYFAASPAAPVIDQARRVVAVGAACAGVSPADLAYARVDGIVRDVGGAPTLVLMELECIEPSLFFLQAPWAASRMADSMRRRIKDRDRSHEVQHRVGEA